MVTSKHIYTMYTMQGDKKSGGMIKNQRPFGENARDVSLQVKRELIYTVDIDGKLFSIIERTAVFKQLCLDHGSGLKALKSHSSDRRRQNVSQNIFPYKILPSKLSIPIVSPHTKSKRGHC